MADLIDDQAIAAVEAWLKQLQDALCVGFGAFEKHNKFIEDAWDRKDGGGGRTRVLSAGRVFESAGVNFSNVSGDALPAAASALRPELAGRSFRAMGVSVVVHPQNPYVPTSSTLR